MIRRWIATAFAFTALLAAGANSAHAQLGWSGYAVGEFDDEDTALALVGVTIGPRGLGWKPYGGAQAYWLQFDNGIGTTSVTSITPSVGLRNTWSTGSLGLRVGYNFSSRDIDGFIANQDVGDGVVNSVALDHWGTGNVYLQGLATYNYGSENFWSRARGLFRVFNMGDGNIMAGGEVAYLNSNNYSSVQPGLVVAYTPGRATTFNFGVGRRTGDGNDATYFKAELVLSNR